LTVTEKVIEEARRDVLAYAYSYIKLPSNTKWEHRPWMADIYNTINPHKIITGEDPSRRTTIIKSTQSGLTTMGLIKALHMMTEYNLNIGYSLPREDDITDLVRAKLNPIVKQSPYIFNSLGDVDAVGMKQFKDAFIYFMGMTTEPRMLTCDVVMNDEVDLSNPDHVVTMQNRMDDSDWQLTLNYSTPTLKGYGIHALYTQSSMYEWYVPCPHCGERQKLDWIKNVRVVGMKLDPDEVNYICHKCQGVMTTYDFLKGEWVAELPKLVNFHKGYHINQMMFYQPKKLYMHFVDPLSTVQEFFRKRIGIPYVSGSAELGYDWLMDNATEIHGMDRGKYYIGIDQGNTLNIVVIRRYKKDIEIVHAETTNSWERLRAVISVYSPIAGVIDADPNRKSATTLSGEYNGDIKIADYSATLKQLYKVTKLEKFDAEQIAIRRSQAFDLVMDMISEKEIFLARETGIVPEWGRELFTHIGNLKRDIEESRTPLGLKQKVVWRSVGADHYAHGLLYAVIASESHEGGTSHIRVMDGKSEEDVEERIKQRLEDLEDGKKKSFRVYIR